MPFLSLQVASSQNWLDTISNLYLLVPTLLFGHFGKSWAGAWLLHVKHGFLPGLWDFSAACSNCQVAEGKVLAKTIALHAKGGPLTHKHHLIPCSPVISILHGTTMVPFFQRVLNYSVLQAVGRVRTAASQPVTSTGQVKRLCAASRQ